MLEVDAARRQKVGRLASQTPPSCNREHPRQRSGGEKPHHPLSRDAGMRTKAGREKKGTYCTDKGQADASGALQKGVVALIRSPRCPSSLLFPWSPSPPPPPPPPSSFSFTARCWLDRCSLPWQPESGRSRGRGGGGWGSLT